MVDVEVLIISAYFASTAVENTGKVLRVNTHPPRHTRVDHAQPTTFLPSVAGIHRALGIDDGALQGGEVFAVVYLLVVSRAHPVFLYIYPSLALRSSALLIIFHISSIPYFTLKS